MPPEGRKARRTDMRGAARLRRIRGRQRTRPGLRLKSASGSLRQYDYLGADLHAIEQVDHILVGKPDAAARYILTDRGRIVGPVDAILGATDIHGARAERIARAASGHARQVRLACDHLARRIPVRPLGLARDVLHARPGEALAADPNAVAERLAAAEHVVEIRVRRVD